MREPARMFVHALIAAGDDVGLAAQEFHKGDRRRRVDQDEVIRQGERPEATARSVPEPADERREIEEELREKGVLIKVACAEREGVCYEGQGEKQGGRVSQRLVAENLEHEHPVVARVEMEVELRSTDDDDLLRRRRGIDAAQVRRDLLVPDEIAVVIRDDPALGREVVPREQERRRLAAAPTGSVQRRQRDLAMDVRAVEHEVWFDLLDQVVVPL